MKRSAVACLYMQLICVFCGFQCLDSRSKLQHLIDVLSSDGELRTSMAEALLPESDLHALDAGRDLHPTNSRLPWSPG